MKLDTMTGTGSAMVSTPAIAQSDPTILPQTPTGLKHRVWEKRGTGGREKAKISITSIKSTAILSYETFFLSENKYVVFGVREDLLPPGVSVVDRKGVFVKYGGNTPEVRD